MTETPGVRRAIRLRLEGWLSRVWYEDGPGLALRPLSWLFAAAVASRRWAFRAGLLRSLRIAVPVIVVGNLTVGGTGKTPLVVWLVERLRERGFQPGVVSRGYGSVGGSTPRAVSSESDPATVGDEPVLLARRCGCILIVGADRPAAASAAVERGCDLIIADDGLQHYRLARDVEIVVIDGARGLGNGRLLPAGPLREPARRLHEAQAVVVNGDGPGATPGGLRMRVSGDRAVRLDSGESRPLTRFAGQAVHAIAGIGNPERFFGLLEAAGLTLTRHVFADHARYGARDFELPGTEPILMTEKDAVKCARIATAGQAARLWYVPVDAHFAQQDAQRLMSAIVRQLEHGHA